MGKLATSVIQYDHVAVVAGSREFLGPNPRRYRLRIFPPAINRVTISHDPIGGDGQGITLSPGQTPIEFCLDDHGDELCKPWYVFYLAGGSPIAWVETLA